MRARRPRPVAAALAAAALAAAALAAPAFAAAAPAPAGPEASPEVGRSVVSPVERPAAGAARACSFTLPICVHAPAGAPPDAALEALAGAERALRTYDALGLPRPLPDGDRGGDPAFDVYLAPGPWQPVRVGADMRLHGEVFDTASAFAVVAAPAGARGCMPAADVAYALGHAIAVRLDAGADEGVLAMVASYLAWIAAPCAAADLPAIDAFQRAPERALTGGALGARDGSLLFPWFLDEVYGAGSPGRLPLALLAVSAQKTSAAEPFFRDEPDAFDALRESLPFHGSTLEDLLLDFAVARAFAGSRSDGLHLADAARLGDFGRVRFEWSIPFDTLPRRVAPLRPIEPTGATYLWLDLASHPPGAEVTFVFDWELPAVFRWALVKVDASGAEAGRLEVGGVFGSTHAERTLIGLDGLAGVLIAGVHAGSLVRTRPFDPGGAPYMPNAYTVWMAR